MAASGKGQERGNRLGEILVADGRIERSLLSRALELQQKRKREGRRTPLGEVLIELGVAERDVLWALAFQARLHACDLAGRDPAPEGLRYLAPHEWKKRRAFPLRMDGKELVIAVDDPEAVETLRAGFLRLFSASTNYELAARRDLDAALGRFCDGRASAEEVQAWLGGGVETIADSASGASELIGTSAAIRKLREEIARLAKAGCRRYLVTGETGAGKELVAHLIHKLGRPQGGRMERFDEATDAYLTTVWSHLQGVSWM